MRTKKKTTILAESSIVVLVIVTTLLVGCRRAGPGVSQQQDDGQLTLLWQREATILRDTEAMKFSPDGNYLAAWHGQTDLWQVQDGRLVATIPRAGFIFSPDSKLLMTEETGYQRAQRVRVRRRPDSRMPKNDETVDEERDRKWTAGSWGGALWRVEDATQVRAFPNPLDPQGRPWRVAFSPDGNHLLGLARSDGKVGKVWRLEDGTLERSFTFDGMPEVRLDVHLAAVWPDLQRFVLCDTSVNKGGVLSVWQLDWQRQQARLLCRWEPYKVALKDWDFFASGDRLRTAGDFLRTDGWDIDPRRDSAVASASSSVEIGVGRKPSAWETPGNKEVSHVQEVHRSSL